MKTKTWLPVFPGFYNTIFEAWNEDSEIDDINNNRRSEGLPEIDYDDCNWNYDEYHKDVAEQCTYIIESELQDMGLIESIRHEKLRSPRFYNYSNDAIDIEVKMLKKHIALIKKYLTNNETEFSKYLKDRYTSCSGFISSYSKYIADWHDFAEHGHKLGSVLNFILLNEGFDQDSLYDQLTDNYVYCINYNELCVGEGE